MGRALRALFIVVSSSLVVTCALHCACQQLRERARAVTMATHVSGQIRARHASSLPAPCDGSSWDFSTFLSIFACLLGGFQQSDDVGRMAADILCRALISSRHAERGRCLHQAGVLSRRLHGLINFPLQSKWSTPNPAFIHVRIPVLVNVSPAPAFFSGEGLIHGKPRTSPWMQITNCNALHEGEPPTPWPLLLDLQNYIRLLLVIFMKFCLLSWSSERGIARSPFHIH